jgi:ParB-like chromosome segregation protein Spo0J
MTSLEFHPLASMFPLLEGEEFAALVADIRMHGLRERITVFEDMILDGRNRYRACLEAGIEPTFTAYIGDDPQGFVVSMNMHRRHLTAEQKREKRELIAKLLQANPTKSDRQIAKTVKTSPTTVGKVRSAMEAKGEVSKVDTRTDAKGVKQPAKKKQRPKHTEVAPTVKPVQLLPADTEGSWREVVDDDGKRWGDGVRLRSKKEASAYLGYAVVDLRNAATLMELRVVASDDKPNVSITFGKTGYPRLFEHGQCGLLRWAVETERPFSNPAVPVDDGLDIPECLRRTAS